MKISLRLTHFSLVLKSTLDAVMHCLLLKKSLSVLLNMVGKFTVLLYDIYLFTKKSIC